MTQITLQLAIEQINALIYALGELPTNTGAYELISIIRQQTAPQVPTAPAVEESATTEETEA